MTVDPASSDRDLVARAREAAANSYSPYSSFRVGAIVVAEGVEYPGVNVENAAYGSSICAEATAIAGAASDGVRSIDVVAVGGLDGDEVYPCGNCRQLMREFGVERVIVQVSRDGDVRAHTLEELLAHSFGPDSLG